MRTIAIFPSCHRGGLWAVDLCAGGRGNAVSDLGQESEPLLSILTVTANDAKRPMGRQACLTPVVDQCGQRGVLRLVEMLHEGVVGMSRLNQHLTRGPVSPGTASHLCQ